MEKEKIFILKDEEIPEDRLISSKEFCTILDSLGTIHITKNCLRYSLINIDYVKSKFYIVTENDDTLLISK